MKKISLALPALAALALSIPAFAAGNCAGCVGAKSAKVKTVVNAKKAPIKTNAAQGEFASISTEALKKAIAQKKVTVIDVNGTESFKAGRIPTAINYAEVGDNLKAQLPSNKNALVVAYCGSPKCGAYKKAAKAASALGYTNVVHYSPGISGWKAAGEAVEKG